MSKDITKLKKELKEQNKFLKHISKSFEDLKKGRVKELKLTE